MPSTWFPKTSEEVTAVPSPPPPPPPPPAPPPSSADRRRDRDRRERIATAVLARIASRPDAKGCARYSVSDADVEYSVQVADMLIQELDKEGGR